MTGPAAKLKRAFNHLVGEDFIPRPVIKMRERKALYDELPSFVGHLPWVEYSHTHKCYRFEDSQTVAKGYNITPFDADGKSGDFLFERRNGLLNVLHSIPDNDPTPWVIQTYLQGSPLTFLKKAFTDVIDDRAKGSKMTEDYLETMFQHIDQLTQPGGIFSDKGADYKAKQNDTKMFLYRASKKSDFPKRGVTSSVDELKSVTSALEQQMKFAKVKFKETDGEDLYNWMLPFFNPTAAEKAGGVEALIKENPYPLQAEKDKDLPLGFDLATACFMATPKINENDPSVLEFQDRFYRYVTLGPLKTKPSVGHLTLPTHPEKPALFDMMPEDSMFSMTMTVLNQHELRAKCQRLADGKVGEDEEAVRATIQASDAVELFSHDHKGYQLNMGVYVRGSSIEQLKENTEYIIQTLRAVGLNPIESSDDLLSQNNFIKNLPMAYQPELEKKDYSSHLTYTHHLANLLPIWGRGRGTGNLGFLFWNRSGEPLMFNPFHKDDRRRAAHGLLLGPTGSGKSATICYLVEQLLALFKPRIFLIESGNSFGLLANEVKAKGLVVNHVRISTTEESSGLSPFADAVKLLDGVDIDLGGDKTLRELEKIISGIYGEVEENFDEILADAAKPLDENEDGDEGLDEERDLIGEMELAATLMITGGEEEEVKNYTRADRNMVRTAIFLAAYNVKITFADNTRSHNQVLPTDISTALFQISEDKSLPEQVALKAYRMYQSLNLFNMGLEAKFFNRPGKAWPDADLTVVDLDRFARKGAEDKLAVLMTGLLNRINDIAEKTQSDGRPIIVIIDEAHVVTVNPLLGPYIAMIGKMWRKLKTWLWLATQNMKDFPDQSTKMLSMAEFWLCLNPDEKEIDEIARFRSLSKDEEALLREATKEPGKYVEGVVLSEVLTTLFRNIPPARSLALAGTEGDEKKARQDIMDKFGVTESEAISHIAAEIFQGREQHRKGFS